jgi:prepilin-type processing-associated H-X9-DG protein
LSEDDKQDDQPIILAYTSTGRDLIPRWRVILWLIILIALLAIAAWWMILSPRHGSGSLPPRAACASNLKIIGCGLIIHANANAGRFPDTLDVLMKQGDFDPKHFRCPCSKLLKPHYVYFPDVDPNSNPPVPVAACKLANHDGHGANVLFTDGHAEWVTPARYKKLLAPYLKSETQEVGESAE